MNHSQQLELSLGKRTELICTPNIILKYSYYLLETSNIYVTFFCMHASERIKLSFFQQFLIISQFSQSRLFLIDIISKAPNIAIDSLAREEWDKHSAHRHENVSAPARPSPLLKAYVLYAQWAISSAIVSRTDARIRLSLNVNIINYYKMVEDFSTQFSVFYLFGSEAIYS